MITVCGCLGWFVVAPPQDYAGAPRVMSLSQLRQTVGATQLYAESHDGFWPAAPDWQDRLKPFYPRPSPVTLESAWISSQGFLRPTTRSVMRVTASRAIMGTRAQDPGQIAFFLSGLPGPSAVGGASDLKYANAQTAIISAEGRTRVVQSGDPLPYRW